HDEEEWSPPSDSPSAQVDIARHIAVLAVRWGKMIHDLYPEAWDGSPIIGQRLSIDDTGLSGVADILFERGVEVHRVVFSASPTGAYRELTGVQRFANVRAEMAWGLRRGLQTGQRMIPERFRRSWQQLPWTLFERKADSLGSVIQLEPKEKVIARHGRSPDTADADMLAAMPTMAAVGMAVAGANGVGEQRPGAVATAHVGVLENELAANRRRRRPGIYGGI
ncbi:MAG: hypothetical protein AAFP86_21320, partial [Planctomycetota bacterium]